MPYVILDENKRPLYNTVFGNIRAAQRVLDLVRKGGEDSRIYHSVSNVNSHLYKIAQYDKRGNYEKNSKSGLRVLNALLWKLWKRLFQ
jgi:hypothetical protein